MTEELTPAQIIALLQLIQIGLTKSPKTTQALVKAACEAGSAFPFATAPNVRYVLSKPIPELFSLKGN